MRSIWSFVIGVAVAFAVSAAMADEAAPSSATADAAATYAKTCAGCHGKDGKGNEKMVKMLKVDAVALDLTATPTLSRTDEDLAKVIASGKGKMPKYGAKLSPAETSAMIAYLRALAPEAASSASATTVTESAAGSTVTAEAVAAVRLQPPPASYMKSCAACHGKDGLGNEKMMKALKSDLAALDLLDDATLGQADEALIKVMADGRGRMPAYGKKLTAEEINAIIAWIRVAKPAK